MSLHAPPFSVKHKKVYSAYRGSKRLLIEKVPMNRGHQPSGCADPLVFDGSYDPAFMHARHVLA